MLWPAKLLVYSRTCSVFGGFPWPISSGFVMWFPSPSAPDVIRQRTAGGWQMVSIEWRRELPDSETPPEGAFSEDIPYGLRISEDCKRLEVDPTRTRSCFS